MKFKFAVSNNEAEYEALLAGLRLAREMEIEHIEAFSDSLLITNQINGTYDTKDDRMRKYVQAVKRMANIFKRFSIKQIPRGDNRKADTLSKLASTSFDHLTKEVLVEVLSQRSINNTRVNAIARIQPEWTTPFIDYLLHRVLPDGPQEARKLKIRSPNYALKSGELYRRGYLVPWLKCIGREEGQTILR